MKVTTMCGIAGNRFSTSLTCSGRDGRENISLNCNQGKGGTPLFSMGDIVLIVDSSAPHNYWPMGKIRKTYPDAKGQVRNVLIKTKSNTLQRPITKLCQLLEADSG